MSIRGSSLKELIALAQQRLGSKAGGLKTRQQLIDALEATEKKAPKVMVALSTPLPEVVPVIERPLPPEPMIWTGDAPLPKITAEVPVKEFPPERLVWSAQVIVAAPIEAPTPAPASFSSEEHVPQFSVPPASRPSPTVTRNFFVAPLRVLTFRRDPTTIYAAWDLDSVDGAQGRVVDRAGQTLQSFDIAAATGGRFLETPKGELKIEIRANDTIVADSAWVATPTPPQRPRNAPSSAV